MHYNHINHINSTCISFIDNLFIINIYSKGFHHFISCQDKRRNEIILLPIVFLSNNSCNSGNKDHNDFFD